MNPALLLMAAIEPSPMAIDDYLMVGTTVMQERGELPSYAPRDEYDRYTVWAHVRGGIVDSQPNTQLGTELGFEFDARIGVTPRQLGENPKLPLALDLSAGLAMRALTFTEPFLGMLVPHLSLELGVGGGHWWSDTPRFAVIGGLRAAIGGAGVGLEADYTLVPFVITGAPGQLRTQHLEHRIAISAGAGPVGLSVWLRFSRQRWRFPDEEDVSSTTGRALGVGIEWRP